MRLKRVDGGGTAKEDVQERGRAVVRTGVEHRDEVLEVSMMFVKEGKGVDIEENKNKMHATIDLEPTKHLLGVEEWSYGSKPRDKL